MPTYSTERESSSRLCEECRSMVDTILPVARARVAVISSGHAGLGAAISVIDDYPSTALAHPPDAEDIDDIDVDPYDGAGGSPGELEWGDPDAALQLQPLPDEEPRTGGLPNIDSENEAPATQSISNEEEEPPAFPSPEPLQAPGLERPASRAARSAAEASTTYYPEETKEEDYKEAVDPWDDPLPAWDYSANEYPVLLSPNKSSNWKKILVPVAVLLFLAAAGAGYYLIFEPSLDPQEVAIAGAPDRAEAQQAEAQQTDPQASAPEQPGQAPAPEDAPAAPREAAAPAQAAAEVESNTGAFSLQAAAFPDEAAALQFSVYLVRASIPSRVVAADLGRRGRWFRVRAGRFASAEEAERYAVQARARAAGLGMNVQLIVCEYEKP
ncbi:MAG TPA: SPOR domain-containing protein [Blastocatellia bacterium]|nr:SPOR domain-containing protein [Blastocatellia bacterium]